MNAIDITREEISRGEINRETLRKISDEFAGKGFAVVANLVPLEVCETLHTSMLEDVEAVRAKQKLTFHEKATGVGHLQLGPRRYAPYVFPELLANPLIESVVTTLIGKGAWLGFYNGNVNCPGSEAQPLHFDRPFSWKTPDEAHAAGQSWPPPSTTVSCSVALSDITIASGATEIYPGTHQETAVLDFAKGEQPQNYPDLIEKWAPTARMEIPAGGICFRDPRMWHRGISNPGDLPRPMVALTYHSALAKHQRGTLVSLTSEQAQQCADNPYLKMLDDGTIGDGRLVFNASGEAQIKDVANPYGVHRNLSFVQETVNHFLDAHLLGGARVSPDGQLTPYPED